MTIHAPFTVTQGDRGRWVAKCACCWKTGPRRTAQVARRALAAHIDHAQPRMKEPADGAAHP